MLLMFNISLKLLAFLLQRLRVNVMFIFILLLTPLQRLFTPTFNSKGNVYINITLDSSPKTIDDILLSITLDSSPKFWRTHPWFRLYGTTNFKEKKELNFIVNLKVIYFNVEKNYIILFFSFFYFIQSYMKHLFYFLVFYKVT